jgi:hypothetical protein
MTTRNDLGINQLESPHQGHDLISLTGSRFAKKHRTEAEYNLGLELTFLKPAEH